MLAVSNETWEHLIAYGIVPLLAALAVWLRAEYAHRKNAREVQAAREMAERADTKTDALHNELADEGAVKSRPAPRSKNKSNVTKATGG